MSAAATAAGYLYASGRLRGRNAREGEPEAAEPRTKVKKRELKVAVYEVPREPPAQAAPPLRAAAAPGVSPASRTMPKISYRTRRWKPE